MDLHVIVEIVVSTRFWFSDFEGLQIRVLMLYYRIT